MKWSPKAIWSAGIGLILLSNAVALGGVAYNRSGEPDSVLRLSERELMLPYGWGFDRENSGLSLALQWRLPVEEPKAITGIGYYNAGGSAKWLDHAKLISLGFDAAPPRNPSEWSGSGRLLPREALLVLEFNGPSYRHAIDVVREHAAREEALQAANPGKDEMKRRAKQAREQLDREENEASRMFIIDAGTDAERLRAAYPDRSRYAIVRGQVRASWDQPREGKPTLTGSVAGIHIDRIHVPLALHASLPQSRENRRASTSAKEAPYEVAVNFGRRFEPWITAAASRLRTPTASAP